MAETIDTLGTALPREIERVQGLLKTYSDPALNGAGAFAIAGMERDLREATRALAEQDVVAMLRVYLVLKEWHS